jgi:hypothetical protein
VLLFVLWELGKLIARRGAEGREAATPGVAPADTTHAAAAA